MVNPPLYPAITAILLLATPASAQHRTYPVHSPAGELIGQGTLSGDRMYVRDLEGKFLYTIVFEANGTRTVYDPDGKILFTSR